MESTTVTTFRCGLVGYFTSPGIDTRRDQWLLLSHPKDTGKRGKRNCQSSEEKSFFYRSGTRTIERPVAGRRPKPLDRPPLPHQWRIQGVFWLPGNPPAMVFFLIRGVTPLLAPTLTSHLHLRRSETPLETNSGYVTAHYPVYKWAIGMISGRLAYAIHLQLIIIIIETCRSY